MNQLFISIRTEQNINLISTWKEKDITNEYQRGHHYGQMMESP